MFETKYVLEVCRIQSEAACTYTQGQANLWLEIIGWVLWLQGKKKKKRTRYTKKGSSQFTFERVLHETKHAS